MTESDDAAARGRAIFQRLRATPPETPVPAGTTTAAPDEPPAAPDAVDTPVRNPLPGLDELAELAVQGPATPIATPASPKAPPPTDDPALAPPPLEDHDGLEASPAAPPILVDAPEVADPPTDPRVEGTVNDPEGGALGSFARPLPRVMAVANQKGGVGKTTTAVNLGACLADIGYRVLVVDLDPQGNASTGLGINIRDLQGSMYDVILHDLPIEDCVEATSVKNLFCAPSSLDLAGAEIELVPAFSRELRLKRALEDVHDDYDFVLIDCPPSLGLLTVNGLAAATEVVVPIQCEYYALEGLGQLLRNVNLVQRNLNPGLEVSAIILVMYDARTKLADQVVSEVREHFGAKVCRNVVPRTVRLSEAPSFGQPIIAFDASSRGAIAYRELAKEVSGGTPQRAR
ncbi:MAG: AAA family ATPase [Microthrixaceae bacterium]